MKHNIKVIAIVKESDKILLLQDKIGKFYLPGEVLDRGDIDLRYFMQKVLKRDLGVDVETLHLEDVVSYVSDGDSCINVVFSVGYNDNDRIKVSDNYKKYVWAKLSEIQHYISDANILRSLRMEESGCSEGDVLKSIKSANLLEDVTIFTDGGSRGNPGPSAAGFVILDSDNKPIFKGGKYLGVTTNNQAEYQAVRLALEKACELGARRLRLNMDSQLIVNQMIGVYKIKNRDLWPIYSNIKCLVERFDKVTFVHVKREFNKEADALVNKVLDREGY